MFFWSCPCVFFVLLLVRFFCSTPDCAFASFLLLNVLLPVLFGAPDCAAPGA